MKNEDEGFIFGDWPELRAEFAHARRRAYSRVAPARPIAPPRNWICVRPMPLRAMPSEPNSIWNISARSSSSSGISSRFLPKRIPRRNIFCNQTSDACFLQRPVWSSRNAALREAISDRHRRGLSVTAVAAQVPRYCRSVGRSQGAWLDARPNICDSPLPGRNPQRNRRIAHASRGRAVDWRAPGTCHCRELSAYMAYRPGAAHTDADRNLISNIHSRGLNPAGRRSAFWIWRRR